MLQDLAMHTTPCTMCSPLFSMVYRGTQLNIKINASATCITNASARMLPVAQVGDTGVTCTPTRKDGR